MKRRHPRQVVDHTEFRPGDKYALIRASGILESEVHEAPRQTIASCEMMTFVEALDNGNIDAAIEALRRKPAEGQGLRLTTHDIHGEIIAALWQWDGALLDKLIFAAMDSPSRHKIFVPSADWATDPRVHVVDWVNPNDVCKAGITWTEEETKLRSRVHNAMRKAHGFDDC